MKKTALLMLAAALFVNLSSITAQIQTGVFRTPVENTDYHQFTRNNTSGAAVFIHQEAISGPILRLSSGTATINQNVKFSFENNGNFGLGTTTSIVEKMVLYSPDTVSVLTQYGNTKYTMGVNKGFVVGINKTGSGMVWHREKFPIAFGTSNIERMRINTDGVIDVLATIRSGGYKIDTTGVFQSKGYRTMAGNANYHHLVADHASNAAVYINQTGTSAPILRLSSGTATFNQNIKFSFENNGNLGIGTATPGEKLSLYTAGNTKVVTQYGNGTGSGFTVGMNTDGNALVWHATTGKIITFGTNNVERMRIIANGNIGIGTIAPDYKLDVLGTIRAHDVLINTQKTADFVFAPDYCLRPLAEVEQFITDHRHLPEIAPAADMLQNGVNMGEFQIQLLQKIEELTLYVIELKKENEAQQKEIDELKNNSLLQSNSVNR